MKMLEVKKDDFDESPEDIINTINKMLNENSKNEKNNPNKKESN